MCKSTRKIIQKILCMNVAVRDEVCLLHVSNCLNKQVSPCVKVCPAPFSSGNGAVEGLLVWAEGEEGLLGRWSQQSRVAAFGGVAGRQGSKSICGQ